ncbi:MAG: hypothetical protein NXI20_28805 [bacterium]|nr:hypothetical protein [bacterium]
MKKFILLGLIVVLISCNTNNNNNNSVDNVKKTYYNNGKPKTIYYLDHNGQMHGQFKAYHENGSIKEKCNYLNGVMHGPFYLWDEKGTLRNQGTFTNGLQTDTSFFFDSLGRLEVYSILGDKEKTLKEVYFHSNNVVKEIAIFYDGRRDLASFKNFTPDGTGLQDFPNSKYALFKELTANELSVTFRGVEFESPDSIKVNYMRTATLSLGHDLRQRNTPLKSFTYANEKEVRLFLRPEYFINGRIIVEVEFYKTLGSVTRVQPYEFHFHEGNEVPKSSLDTY